MRVILDTNIVVSALIWGGTPYKLLQTATAGDIELFTSSPLSTPVAVPTDADDDHVIAVAVAAGADLIVSGDRDLLRLERYGNIAIVDAAEAIQAIASAGGL